MARLGVAETSCHGCLQSEGGNNENVARGTRLYEEEERLDRRHDFLFGKDIYLRDTERPKTLDETCIRRQTRDACVSGKARHYLSGEAKNFETFHLSILDHLHL